MLCEFLMGISIAQIAHVYRRPKKEIAILIGRYGDELAANGGFYG